MNTRRSVVVLLAMACVVSAVLHAQMSPEREDAPLRNWATPLYWHPNEAEAREALLNSDAPRVRSNAAAAALPAPVLPLGTNAMVFVAMTPCRVVDTRPSAGFTGAFGAPRLAGGASRTFPIPTSTRCSIPAQAGAYSFNVTVVPSGPLGFLTMYPTGQALPVAATLNALQGQVVANAAIVPAGTSGSVNVFASNNTDVVIDINGYYSAPSDMVLQNTAIGIAALYSNTTGGSNAAEGFGALYYNTTGNNNTANGSFALFKNTAGADNTGTGFVALESNTTGVNNTAVGSGALQLNTTGNQNTATGDEALNSNTTGHDNTATGVKALQNNTSGIENAAFGNGALMGNTIGGANTAVGFNALEFSTSDANTALGNYALGSDTTGESNIAIGVRALTGVTTGYRNIAVGFFAGSTITGNENIDIGNYGSSSDNGIIRIGTEVEHFAFFVAGVRGVTTNLSNAVPVLIDSNGQLGTISSSRRFKEDIDDMGDSSSGLLRLRPVTFRYKKAYEDGSKPLDYGLIAEEVAEVYPDLIARSADGQIETVQYQKLAPMLLNELQKQQERIRSLESRLASLEALLTAKQ